MRWVEGQESYALSFEEREGERVCEKEGTGRWSPDVQAAARWKESDHVGPGTWPPAPAGYMTEGWTPNRSGNAPDAVSFGKPPLAPDFPDRAVNGGLTGLTFKNKI